jgi:hypothetical protein
MVENNKSDENDLDIEIGEKMANKKKKDVFDDLDKSLKNLNKALKDYQKFLEKMKKKNPSNPTEYERNTATLIFNMGTTIGEIASNIKFLKESITTQTVVSALGFFGLGIVITIGFAIT